MSKLVNTYEEFKAHTDEVREDRGVTVKAVLVVLAWCFDVPLDLRHGKALRRMLDGQTPESIREVCAEIRVAYWHEDMDAKATAECVATTSSDAWKYNPGHTSQELFGIIWYSDGSHSRRAEYDGAEWWEYVPTPDIPAWLTER